MELMRIVVGAGTNCYLYFEEKGPGFIVDPGANGQKLLEILKEREIDLQAVLLTHAHADHIGGLNEIKDHLDVPIYLHRQELAVYDDPKLNLLTAFGWPAMKYRPEELIEDGDTISLGFAELSVLHTPGHTPGSVCYRMGDILFSGDTLFQGSVGRMDLPGGSVADMKASLTRLNGLTENFTVYSGHGEVTTLEAEKGSNPYLRNIHAL
ncbi:MAG: MBL fold metallo-hydrolase [Tissierellia bacterium]|nr:MBL fold metallo-hydrolase [Tissierellia bacterium]